MNRYLVRFESVDRVIEQEITVEIDSPYVARAEFQRLYQHELPDSGNYWITADKI